MKTAGTTITPPPDLRTTSRTEKAADPRAIGTLEAETPGKAPDRMERVAQSAIGDILDRGRDQGELPGLSFPETIETPRLDPRLPGLVDSHVGHELGEETPLPDGVDPGAIPGHDGPDRRPRCEDGLAAVQLWWDLNDANNVAHWDDPSWMNSVDAATRQKAMGMLGRGGSLEERGVFCGPEDDPSKGGGKETGSVTGGKTTDSKPADDAVETKPPEETGVEEEIAKDPEPEGDDPDESRFPMDGLRDDLRRVRDLATSGGGGRGGRDGGLEGPEDAPGRRRFQVEHHRRTRHVDPDPEDGGPDELRGVALAASFAADLTGSADRMPAPGEPDPDDPRASEGFDFSVGSLRDRLGSKTEISIGEDRLPGPDGEDPDDPRAGS